MYETPLLGVNMGHLGFLAEVEVKNLYDSLEYLFSNSIETQKRLMLQASLCSNNVCRNFFALNDISITRGTLSRVISLQVLIDDDFVTSMSGDGIVLATPTGSTAYSLSAGGPVVSPALSAITITPICPHSFSNRSIVISDSETVRIDLNEGSSDAYLTIDGQEGYKIEVGDTVYIKSAPFKTNLIKLSGRSFYDVLRTKLSER
jgi:NAD+ kinase